jgi:hypothetical protein
MRKQIYTRYSYGEDPPRQRKRTITSIWSDGPAAPAESLGAAESLGVGVDLDEGRWKREEE